jgi:hypothetical protein
MKSKKTMKASFILVVLLAITVVFVSCDTLEEQPEGNVLSISYNYFGGMDGFFLEMTFTENNSFSASVL